MLLRLSCYVLLFLQSIVGAVNRHGGLRQHSSYNSFVRALEFNHRLRVCNAYPYAAPLDVYIGKTKLTNEPMPYKKCDEFKTSMKVGDKVDFRIMDSTAGTFTIADLPNNDAVLLLMIHRHDSLSTAVSFESHVFANLQNAQVAVIDTYKGPEKATLKIQDVKDEHTSSRSEELRYDSVVAVNPGKYEVVLVDGPKVLSKAPLTALSKEKYIVMRVGVDAQQGEKYPQELVVYPQSDSRELRSAAHSRIAGPLVLLSMVLGLCLH